jgi:hypothetical protein
MKFSPTFLLLLLFVSFITCKKSIEQTKNSENKILKFSFEDSTPVVICAIDNSTKLITGTMPIGTDLSHLKPTIEISAGATATPASGLIQNFSTPLTYTIKAENGDISSYVVNLTATTSAENRILKFAFNDSIPGVTCTIGDSTIVGVMPIGTDLTHLKPTIDISARATITPSSGIIQNFTLPAKYTVKAENGLTRIYTVTLTALKNTEKQIKSFVFNSFNPIINANVDTTLRTVKFRIPPGSAPTGLYPTITISNRATIVPNSGVMEDFTNPITYRVTAEDSLYNDYTTELLRPTPSVKDIPSPPKYLCIFYGYPSLVNGSAGNTTAATNFFKDFDIIVFGDNLWKTSHPDYTNTKTIIANLRALKPSIKIFGYIDIGVTTQNLTDVQIKSYVDGWQQMGLGITGVFGDDFGYDYGVTRPRQNSFVDYAHSKSLSVFANSWNIGDALGGNDSHLDSAHNDFYLLESFLVSDGSYTTLQTNIDKANAAYFYMKTKKVGIACVTTLPSVTSTSNNTDKFKMSWHGTAMYNFDAFQFTETNFSSISSVAYYFPNPITSYGTSWVQFDWIKKVSNTRYERSTNTNTFYIDGDGATNGTGGH